ncbi:hypothetical protein GCM10010218_26870 [Streptomyces mashuensis]|uniref:Uncharacterized protein n=1 Tax=Streptomyces mashuensis TaxID=33904 RepID=A0A919B496_9ACTN|nr:hypothetical protein [Streptomyces mashuensis]GHF44180.1 hypothetical protein GCM10010218_26870 [Streptomyces mashuensis]
MSTEVGPWRGAKEKREDHLTLTAEENRVVTARWEAAKAARGRLDGLLGEVGERTAAHGGRLEGLEYSLKGLDSFRRKAAGAVDRGDDVEDVVADVDDLNRYTLTFEPDGYVEGTRQAYGELRARGFEPISEQNTWEDPVYKGVNTAWQHPETKEKFELQFHTPDSFKAKTDNHELYELTRSGQFAEHVEKLDDLTPQQKAAMTKQYVQAADLLQNERYENVRIPPGVDELGNRKIRAKLNPDVNPEIVAEVRRMESDLRETHAAAATAASAGPQQQTNRLSTGLDETLQTEGPRLRNNLATKRQPERRAEQRQNAVAPAVEVLPTQSQGRGPSLK